jgi:hypothetical protein
MRKLLSIAIVLAGLMPHIYAQQAPVNPCEVPEARDFDFHLGTWVTRDGKETHQIEKFLDGCAIRETWTGEGGQFAAGVKSYDKGRWRWMYSWIGRGFYHQLWEGRKEDGQWRFYREWALDGQAILSRTYWTLLADGSIDRIVEQSRDGGKTWKPHVKTNFVKKK